MFALYSFCRDVQYINTFVGVFNIPEDVVELPVVSRTEVISYIGLHLNPFKREDNKEDQQDAANKHIQEVLAKFAQERGIISSKGFR